MIEAITKPKLAIMNDRVLLFLAVVATFVGTFFAHDAGYARSILAGNGPVPREFKAQLAFAVIGMLIAAWVSARGVSKWQTYARPLFYVSFVALVYVHFFGKELNGARRWIDLGFFDVQPAEFVKLTTVLFLAACFADRKPLAIPKRVSTLAQYLDKVFVPKVQRWMPIVWVTAAALLVELEPDLGTAAIVVGIAISLMILGGVSSRSLFAFCAVGMIVVTGLTIKEPYRLDRILNHNSRWSNEFVDDVGYQTTHSESGMATGALVGVGMGSGRSKHMLPAATTDFVMATVAEEFGLVGSLGVIGLLAAICFRLTYLARRCATRFGALMLGGFACWIGLQACVNVMMANGFLPAIGIPLPFISSGGSSLLALWLAVGASQSVVGTHPKEAYALSRNGWRHRRPRLSRA